jgi:hypothetical protein
MNRSLLALAAGLIVIVISGFMYLVTTFLFAFSGGQYRMEPIVQFGALTVIAAMLLLAAIVWRVRSPVAAVICAAIVTPIAWVVLVVVEWGLSFEFGAG